MSYYPTFSSTLNIDQKDCYSIPQVLLGNKVQMDYQANSMNDKYTIKDEMIDDDPDIDNDDENKNDDSLKDYSFYSYNKIGRPMTGDSTMGSKGHNVSEKRRVAKMNQQIKDLYELLDNSGVIIGKNKINILTETVHFIKQVKGQIKNLSNLVKEAEIVAKSRLDQVNEHISSININYHVLFLQNSLPQAILSTNGQFINANIQFKQLLDIPLDQLRTYSLFNFAPADDLPCTFGSWSYMLNLPYDSEQKCVYQSILRHCYIKGQIKPVLFSLSLLRDSRGKPSHFLCTVLPVLHCDCVSTKQLRCNGYLHTDNNEYVEIIKLPGDIPDCRVLNTSLLLSTIHRDPISNTVNGDNGSVHSFSTSTSPESTAIPSGSSTTLNNQSQTVSYQEPLPNSNTISRHSSFQDSNNTNNGNTSSYNQSVYSNTLPTSINTNNESIHDSVLFQKDSANSINPKSLNNQNTNITNTNENSENNNQLSLMNGTNITKDPSNTKLYNDIYLNNQDPLLSSNQCTNYNTTSSNSYTPPSQPISLSVPSLPISRNNSIILNNAQPPVSLSIAPMSFSSSLSNPTPTSLPFYSSSTAYPYSVETAMPQYGFPSIIKTSSLSSTPLSIPIVNGGNTTPDNQVNSVPSNIPPHFTPNPYIYYEKKPSYFKDPIF